MANHGGARPGSGRTKGAKVTRTQELVKKALADGLTPMDVILGDMRFFHSLGEEQLNKARELQKGKEQAKAFRAAASLKDTARQCAVAAAPYVHPKLSSVQADVTLHGQETALTELE
jgi:hypothetical protein